MDTVVVFTPAPGPSGILDDFNRANEDLEASANWSLGGASGELGVVSNTLQRTGGPTTDSDSMLWVTTFNADQWAEIELTSAPSASGSIVMVYLRWQDTSNYIRCLAVRNDLDTSEEYYIWEVDGGTATSIGSYEPNGTISYPDTIRCEVVGTGVEMFLNDVSILTATTGVAGTGQIGVSQRNGNWILDNFDGGNL